MTETTVTRGTTTVDTPGSLQNLDLLIPVLPGPPTGWVWATVTQASTHANGTRIRLDGEVSPLPIKPEILAGPLTVGMRVWAQIQGRRVIVHGPTGGVGGGGGAAPTTLAVEDTTTLDLTLTGSPTTGYLLKGDVKGGTGGATTLEVEDSPTLDLTLSPTPTGYSLRGVTLPQAINVSITWNSTYGPLTPSQPLTITMYGKRVVVSGGWKNLIALGALGAFGINVMGTIPTAYIPTQNVFLAGTNTVAGAGFWASQVGINTAGNLFWQPSTAVPAAAIGAASGVYYGEYLLP